jgi:hypothetical protein
LWLLVGAVAAGAPAADFITLVSSTTQGLGIPAYGKDVLDKSLAGSSDYESPRPNRWRGTLPEFIRQYDVAECRDPADRK